MVLDIDLLRPEKGGNPEQVRQSEKDRYKDTGVVDKIMDLDNEWRKGSPKSVGGPAASPAVSLAASVKTYNILACVVRHPEEQDSLQDLQQGLL